MRQIVGRNLLNAAQMQDEGHNGTETEGYTARRGHNARSSDYAAHRVQQEWFAIWKLGCEVGCREANEAAAHRAVCLHEHVSAYDLEVAILGERLGALVKAHIDRSWVANSVGPPWVTMAKDSLSWHC